mmetsp:Transcript_9346/g.13689  ORF Transcript_9346/g.13689 Transcript_9346/m.13689 type:complete len:246 (+) Transcript_9346:195-932(+)
MANFGELVLVLGDLHIPQRAGSIPEKFKRMLVPNKMQHVICTGNLGCKEQYEELRELAPNVHVVTGDFEYESPASSENKKTDPSSAMNAGILGTSAISIMTGDTEPTAEHEEEDGTLHALPTMPSFPDTKVVQVGHFRIGVVHGHQIVPWGDHMSLAMVRRKLDVDILISGHTHKNEVVEHDGCYHINPGSITGAYSSLSDEEVTPSFILLAVQGSKVVCYVYELVNGEVDVSKTEFTKSMSTGV